MVELWAVVVTKGWGKMYGLLEAQFVVVGACNIAAPEEDGVSICESTILDMGGGGVVKGNGEVAKIGGYPFGDGVIRDGEEDG